MKGFWRVISLWILVAVVLPALLSFGIGSATSRYHGVRILAGNESRTAGSFDEAVDYLIKSRYNHQATVSAYLSVPRRSRYFLFLSGVPRKLIVDGHEMRKMSARPLCLTGDPLSPGVHYVIVRLPQIPEDTGFWLSWTDDYADPESIPTDLLYSDSPPPAVRAGSWIATRLGILARLDCVLLLLIPALLWLFKRFRPFMVAMGVIPWLFLAVMLIIRLTGIGYQVQEGIHPDERAVRHIVFGFQAGTLKPVHYFYPPGFHYMTTGVERLIGWVTGAPPTPILVPRLLSGIFSWLACLAVLVLGNMLLTRRYAILACLLFGFSLMPVALAHFGIIEPTMVSFFLLGMIFIVNIRKESGWKQFAAAGIASGLAVGMKQTSAVILIPFLCTYLYTYRKEVFHRTALTKAVWWGGACFLAFLLCAPYTVLDFPHFVRDQIFQSKFLSGHTSAALFFAGGSSGPSAILAYLIDGLGYPLLVTAVIGGILLLRVSIRAFLALVPLAAIFFIVTCMAKAPPYHYPLLLCPLLALMAAAVPEYLASRVRFGGNPLAVALTLVLLLPSLPRVLTLQKILMGTDTRQQAVEWCYKTIPPRASVDVDFFGPRFRVPLFSDRVVPVFARGTWEQFEKHLPSYYIVDSLTEDSSVGPDEWHANLRERFDLVQEFRGNANGMYNPRISIYKIRRPGSN